MDEELRVAADMVDAGGDDPPHRRVEIGLTALGWRPCGSGDWAVALQSPSGRLAARISPFDPAFSYTVDLYRRGAGNPYLPRLWLEREWAGGPVLMIMDYLAPVSDHVARVLYRRRRDAASSQDDLDLAEVARLMDDIHGQAQRSLPWCGPLDDSPDNVRQDAAGQLKFLDPFYVSGLILYDKVLSAPAEVVAAIPAERRTFLFDIPAVRRTSGPAEIGRMRAALNRADEQAAR